MKFFRNFFSDSNEINEDVVMGVIFAAALLAAIFLGDIPESKCYILAGLVTACFGLGALKK